MHRSLLALFCRCKRLHALLRRQIENVMQKSIVPGDARRDLISARAETVATPWPTPWPMIRQSLLAVTLLASGQGAFAQPVGATAGGQFQQIPRAPEPPKSIPDIRVDRGEEPPAATPAGMRVTVTSLHVTGATKFSEAELIAASGFRPGVELDLAGLRAMAARISDFYNRHGYFVAQAYLPAQDIANGAVTIAVIEGRYGKVGLDNKSHVSNGTANSLLAGLDPGDPVYTSPLQRRLLLLSDLPGVAVKATLSPGATEGTSDLTVGLAATPRITGSLEADNSGNRYTGAYRGGATVNVNEPFGIGDVASLRYLTAGGGLNYVRASYQAQLGALTLGASFAHLGYRLGREFKPLHGHGTANVAGLYASYPLVRSRDTNLHALAGVDYRTFTDKVDATSSIAKRTAVVGMIGLNGDHRDHFLGGGWTSLSLSWSFGDLRIKTDPVRAIDRITARTNGSYNKFAFDLIRLQSIAGPLSLYGEARGQLASKNLDSSEKMELGGAYGVRAYPEGEAYGDQGYILTAEARLKIATLKAPVGGDIQAIAFVDHGSVRLDKHPWLPGDNHRTLSAAGAGLTWSGAHGLMIKTAYAFKLGNEHATSAPDHSGRFWFQISKFF
jgi:hemolysin activation/secretion protein